MKTKLSKIQKENRELKRELGEREAAALKMVDDILNEVKVYVKECLSKNGGRIELDVSLDGATFEMYPYKEEFVPRTRVITFRIPIIVKRNIS